MAASIERASGRVWKQRRAAVAMWQFCQIAAWEELQRLV
jgi:hypothetical protein